MMTLTVVSGTVGCAWYSRVLGLLTDRGEDTYAGDKALVARLDAEVPDLRAAMRSGHLFTQRAIRAVTENAGPRQLAVIGMDYPRFDSPSDPDPHQVPAAHLGVRTLYVDDEEFVLVHGRARLRGSDLVIVDTDPTEASAVLHALADSGFGGQPTVVRLGALLLESLEDPHAYMRALIAGLPVGSVLILTHVSADHDPAAVAAAVRHFAAFGLALVPKSGTQVAALLDGLDLLAPGLVHAHRWRPESARWARREHARGWAPAPKASGMLYAVCAEKRS